MIETYRVELDVAIQQQETQQSDNDDDGVWRVGYCVYNLWLAVYAAHGYDVWRREADALLHDQQSLARTQHQRRWLQLSALEFMQQHAASGASPLVAPRDWRCAVSAAVATAPHDAALLRLFVDAEASSTMSQRLRKHFTAVQTRAQRRFDSPRLVEWLFALLCELSRLERAATVHATSTASTTTAVPLPTCCLLHKFRANTTGIARLRRVLYDMVESERAQRSALSWRLLLRVEVALGKVDSARRAFYRGVAKCPWSKALFVDGVRVLRPYLSTNECNELLELMAAKELHVREEEEEVDKDGEH